VQIQQRGLKSILNPSEGVRFELERALTTRPAMHRGDDCAVQWQVPVGPPKGSPPFQKLPEVRISDDGSRGTVQKGIKRDFLQTNTAAPILPHDFCAHPGLDTQVAKSPNAAFRETLKPGPDQFNVLHTAPHGRASPAHPLDGLRERYLLLVWTKRKGYAENGVAGNAEVSGASKQRPEWSTAFACRQSATVPWYCATKAGTDGRNETGSRCSSIGP